MDALEPSPAEPAPAAAPARRPVNRRHVMMLVLPIIPMWAAVQIGGALFPTLSTENPTLLILLSPANRNLIIAAANASDYLQAGILLPAVLYAVIGVLRLLAPDPFFYAIGESYGDGAISWMERRTPTFGQLLRELERLFAKAGWIFVLILPNTYVCLLAGAANMRKSWFWTLNIIGTIGRVALMWFIGQTFQDLIDKILGFITDHRTLFLVLSVGLVGFTLIREWRSGTSEVQQLMELEHEMEHELGADGTGPVTNGTEPARNGDTPTEPVLAEPAPVDEA